MTPTQRTDGEKLERETEQLLRLFPGSHVQRQISLAGKKVDLLFTTSTQLLPNFKVAVECKDWNKPLTREQCASIIADYATLLQDRLIDQFLLVTRKGVVAGAKPLFDDRQRQQLTWSQLANRLFDPMPLLENIRRQYLDSPLSKTYVEQHAIAPDMLFAAMHYDALFNDFIDLALEMGASTLRAAHGAWTALTESPPPLHLYKSVAFEQCIAHRKGERRVQLLQLVMSWIDAEGAEPSLALLGGYGTGKSSFSHHLAYTLAERHLENPLNRIPFLIELRDFGSHQDIRGLVTHELVNRHGVTHGSFELFQSLNAAGRFVIILDGFDEMKQGMTLDSLLYNFHQLGQLNVGNSRVILCGRPTLFESRAEQHRIMSGGGTLNQTKSARYIQLRMAPFSEDESCRFLERLAQTSEASAKSRILEFVSEFRDLLRQEARTGSPSRRLTEVKTLLSRPVHIPMLARVLPARPIRPTSLSRARLYSEFIDAIIEREMLKRRPEFTSAYGASARRDFAREVAYEMARRGESSSIRSSELPATLFEKFVSPGRPLEAVRRDLISACFLERKGADVLFFPHKSFWEFLTAEWLASYLQDSLVPDTDNLGFKISDEILEFLVDLTNQNTSSRIMGNVLNNIANNSKIFLRWLRLRQRSPLQRLNGTLLDRWRELLPTLPVGIQRGLALYLEGTSQHGKLINAHAHLARALIQSEDDVVAVHAFRALMHPGARSPSSQLLALVPAHRLLSWIQHRWIETNDETAPHFQDMARSRLMELLTQRSKIAGGLADPH